MSGVDRSGQGAGQYQPPSLVMKKTEPVLVTAIWRPA
jgi:hypothetical protein